MNDEFGMILGMWFKWDGWY